jgi:hypothetical protein
LRGVGSNTSQRREVISVATKKKPAVKKAAPKKKK